MGESPEAVARGQVGNQALDDHRRPSGRRAPLAAVADGQQFHLEADFVARTRRTQRIELRRGNEAGSLQGHGLNAHRLLLPAGEESHVVAAEQVPALVVPSGGQCGYGQRQHDRRSPVLPFMLQQAPAGEAGGDDRPPGRMWQGPVTIDDHARCRDGQHDDGRVIAGSGVHLASSWASTAAMIGGNYGEVDNRMIPNSFWSAAIRFRFSHYAAARCNASPGLRPTTRSVWPENGRNQSAMGQRPKTIGKRNQEGAEPSAEYPPELVEPPRTDHVETGLAQRFANLGRIETPLPVHRSAASCPKGSRQAARARSVRPAAADRRCLSRPARRPPASQAAASRRTYRSAPPASVRSRPRSIGPVRSARCRVRRSAAARRRCKRFVIHQHQPLAADQ